LNLRIDVPSMNPALRFFMGSSVYMTRSERTLPPPLKTKPMSCPLKAYWWGVIQQRTSSPPVDSRSPACETGFGRLASTFTPMDFLR
jgi:hypothetical protein